MAIIIPSKSIYRQNNPKVRDNVVDKYTINSKNVVSANEFDTVVANKTIGNANKGIIYREEPNYGFDIDYAVSKIPNPPSAGDPHYYATLIVGCQDIVPIFKKVIFYVPKQFNTTKVISSLNNLIDTIEEGNTKKTIPKINYTVTSNLYIGDGQVDVEIPSEFSELERSNIKIINTYPRNFSNASPQKVKFTTDNLKMDVNRVVGGGEYPIISRKFNYFYIGEGKENGTISAVIKEEGNKYKIETEVIVGCYLDSYYTFETELAYADLVDHPFDNFQQLKGESKFYEPLSIEFTLNGDIIGIDLENNTLEYTSKNGKANFSIDGNELTQTTNYYETEDNLLLEKQADNILDAYQNGKETATIRCSIVDYYDENGDLAISTSGENLLNADKYTAIYNATYENGVATQNNSTGNREFKFDLDGINDKGNILSKPISLTQTIYANRALYFEFKKTSEFDKILFSRVEGISTSIEYDVSNLINDEVYTFSVEVEVDGDKCKWAEMQIYKGQEIKEYEPFYPMCFQQYDEVIPMDYAVVNGKTQDVPMSTYKDGTPKQFQVLSTNIEYDGSVMQTLELQEILQKQQPTFIRVYTVEFLLDNYVYAKKTTVDGKVYELPDDPSISAGYDFDGWYTEPNGGGEKVTTNTTFTKDTKVYANVVEDMTYTVDVTFYDTVKGIETITTGLGGYLNAVPAPKSKKYYVFAGYATLQNGEGIRVTKQYKFTEDTNLYPYYVEEPTASLFDEVYKNINQNAKDIQELDNKIEGIINPDNPDNPDTDETIYQDFVSYGDQEDNSVSGFGATGLDTSALEEYLSTATPVDGNSYEINIKPTVTNEFGSEATVEVIHSYAFADYSDILGEKQLTYVIPTTVTAFGYKAFDLTNASIVFLGDNNQFEEILANSATQWCSVSGSGGNSGTGSYGKDVTVKFGGINGASFNYFVPFTEEP